MIDPSRAPERAAPLAGGTQFDLLARWQRDLLDWPTPALLVDTAHVVVAINPLAATAGIAAGSTLDAALACVAAAQAAQHEGRARPGLQLRMMRVETEDFRGWFVDLPDAAGPPAAGLDRATSRRLADSNLRLQEEIRRRRVLERQVLSVAESEKRRISLELHDGLGQHLTGLAFLARSLADQLKGEQHLQSPDAEWLVHLLNQAISKARALARGLWPVNLERESLVASVRRLAEDLESIYGVSCAVQAVDVPDIETNVAANHIYRILQEASNNAIKHGRARRLTFRLEALSEGFAVSVLSDGVSIDPADLGRGPGLGVTGMRVRAESMGGSVSIEPLPAGGTEVSLLLPGVGVRRPAGEEK